MSGRFVSSTATASSRPLRKRSPAPALIPCIIAIVLALPCFSFPFLWDDFDFLGRGQHLHATDLLPNSQVIFYRPLSRELYFGLLNLLGASPLVGHALNALGLIAVIFLLCSIVRRLAGDKAGFLAGFVFSGLGALPVLVGWTSGIQDILAMIFVLATILMELKGRAAVAALMFVGGLLSKETTLAFLPAVLLVGSMRDGGLRFTFRKLYTYGGIAVAWAAIHPGVRHTLSGGLEAGSGGYLASPSLYNLESAGNALLCLLNIPLGAGSWEGFASLSLPLVLALALLWAAYGWSRRAFQEEKAFGAIRWAQLIWLACLLTVPPLLMTGLFLRHWSPYYTCISSLGLSLLAGAWLAVRSFRTACLLVSAFLCLGAWSRTAAMAPTVTTEMNLRRTGLVLNTVERGFKRLQPVFPESSHVYVSAQVSGPSGLYTHLFRYQPLRTWYREPSLYLLDTNHYRSGARAEFLFWISRELDVFEINLGNLAPRTNGPAPRLSAYQKTLRTFALGRAAAGDVDQAVRILVTMPNRPPLVIAYDRRAAGALLYSVGRDSDGDALLKGAPTFNRGKSLNAVLAMVADPTPGLDLDDAAMRAFGLSPLDLAANHWLMLAFDQLGYGDASIRFAQRTLTLNPLDPDAQRLLQKWSRSDASPQVTVPIPHK